MYAHTTHIRTQTHTGWVGVVNSRDNWHLDHKSNIPCFPIVAFQKVGLGSDPKTKNQIGVRSVTMTTYAGKLTCSVAA